MQLLVSCEFPHQPKNKSMVRYVFCDAPSLIIDLLDKGDVFCDLAHILEHQIDAMGSAWSPNHHVVPLH
jgi:hypothetical protein